VVTGAKTSHAIWLADEASAKPTIGAQRLRGFTAGDDRRLAQAHF